MPHPGAHQWRVRLPRMLACQAALRHHHLVVHVRGATDALQCLHVRADGGMRCLCMPSTRPCVGFRDLLQHICWCTAVPSAPGVQSLTALRLLLRRHES